MKEDILNTFLDAQEHPENYSEEELKEIMQEGKPLADLKHAIMEEKAKKQNIDVNAEWDAFSKAYLQSSATHSARTVSLRWLRIVAMFVGVIFLAGAAFAAIVSFGVIKNPFKNEVAVTDTVQSKKPMATTTNKTIAVKDTIQKKQEPMVKTFDDVNLEMILTEMGKYYGARVSFKNEGAKNIRLYFEWDQQKSLDDNITMLNSFQQITIGRDNNTIVVE